MNTKTAILIFARSAEEDARHKSMHNGVQLFEALNKQTLKTVKQSGLPFYIYSEKNQKGATFAERYIQAFTEIYELGYDNVISIGNDSPHLTKQHLLTAASELQNCPMVIGPSVDGGFYLMGLNKSHFNAQALLELPWQTSKLTQIILRKVREQKIQATILEVLYDLDSVSDVAALLNRGQLPYLIKKLLLRIHYRGTQPITNQKFFFDAFQYQNYFNKGSPVSLSI
ncbi:TIGR04282 family arsenosugar biosynthesis glycosyltransferase [Leeuwenhoekiella sp. UBA6783]|uniref:TIGR04282 family arsenosugar biosynthesis glycosyltransferase n=1 Tax=Leeuwenhoekiella sp. UBA6783 TaxID=1946747 RepID=UPI0025BB6ED9|nr:DUF2064 domain-containing protein [Leeuwenhoekiella sp. UBA6783]